MGRPLSRNPLMEEAEAQLESQPEPRELMDVCIAAIVICLIIGGWLHADN